MYIASKYFAIHHNLNILEWKREIVQRDMFQSVDFILFYSHTELVYITHQITYQVNNPSTRYVAHLGELSEFIGR